MPTERIRHEIKQLIAETDALALRVNEVSAGTRYARTQEKVYELYNDLRQARSHVAAAVAALNGEERASDEEKPGRGGWLRERVVGLSRRLMGREEEEEEEEELEGAAPARNAEGFQGDSWSIPLPDLIGFLQLQRKTGVLSVELAGERVGMQFDDGLLVSAVSNRTPEGQRLGEILVQMGAIDTARLQSFLACFSVSRGRLGEALMRGELVHRDVLRRAVERQVQLLFHRLLQATDARYSFREGPIEMEAEGSRFNVTQLLLESARFLDEQGENAA